MRKNSNYNSNNHKDKILEINLDNFSHQRNSDSSIDFLQYSNYSMNTNIYSKKIPNILINNQILNTKNEDCNTINSFLEDDLYFSKKNLEYDLHISALKKKLTVLKKNRKGVELNITNLKKKIKELEIKEKRSLKQIEYTKNYINRIMQNSKKNKNFGTIITKINNIYQINKSPRNIKFNINNINNYKTLVQTSNRNLNNKKNLSDLAQYSAIKNNRFIHSNKKLKSKPIIINNKIFDNKEKDENLKIYSSPISSKIYIKKNITSIRKPKNDQIMKKNILKNIKHDIEEKLKIERELEQITKEQNKLYNNFYENFVFFRSAKTLDLDENNHNFFNNK